MEIFLAVFVFGLLAEKIMVETRHAAAGTTSPRWRKKLMEAERAGQPGYVPRYGSRDWLADLWGDFLKDKTEARRAAAEAKLYGDGPLDQARAVVRAERERRARGEVPVPAKLEPEVQEKTPKGESGRPLPAPEAVEPATPIHQTSPCVNCEVRPSAPGSLWCGPCREKYPERSSWDTRPTPVPDPDRVDARVIPMFKREQVADMSAEVTGLDPAIAHAEQVAKAHEAHSIAGNELYVNGLADAGVGQEDIAIVRAAQEASGIAAAHWRAVVKALTESNKPVQQAYDNSPNAGSKEFQQGGR